MKMEEMYNKNLDYSNKLLIIYKNKDMEREALISKKLLDAQNELNNSLNCATAYYNHKRIQEAFSTLKYWLQKRLASDVYQGKVDSLASSDLSIDETLTSEI